MTLFLPRRRFLGVSAAAAMLACDRGGDESAKRRPLRIGVDLWPGYYPLLMAKAKGLFRPRDLQVEVLIPEDTDTLIADFAAMNLDAIAVALGDLINVTQRNADVRIVMVSDQSDGGDAIMGREPYRGAASLRGKRIGTNLGGFGEILVRSFVEREGVGFHEIELVNVDAAEVPACLRAGEFDAAHTWEPYITECTAAGFHTWFTSHEITGLIPSCVAFLERTIEERRDDVQCVISAWLDTAEWWRNHFEEGAALARSNPRVAASAVSLKGVRLLDRAENRRIFTPSAEKDCVYNVVKLYSDHFVARGSITRPALPEHLVDPSFVVSG